MKTRPRAYRPSAVVGSEGLAHLGMLIALAVASLLVCGSAAADDTPRQTNFNATLLSSSVQEVAGSSGSGAGASLAAVGDANGDGRPDFAVGAPYASHS